jgi:hypothetical protein
MASLSDLYIYGLQSLVELTLGKIFISTAGISKRYWEYMIVLGRI